MNRESLGTGALDAAGMAEVSALAARLADAVALATEAQPWCPLSPWLPAPLSRSLAFATRPGGRLMPSARLGLAAERGDLMPRPPRRPASMRQAGMRRR